MKFVPETIADAIRVYTGANFRSQKDAARHFGVSRAHFSAMVNGLKRPSDKVLAEMGMTLAYVPVDALNDRTFAFEKRRKTEAVASSPQKHARME